MLKGLVAVVLAWSVLTQAQPQDATKVVIIEPLAEDYVTGPVTLKATIEPPETPVTRADFFVDGVSVCRLTMPPFECPYDAGSRVLPRQVRVAMTLEDGRRLIANVRTTGLDLESSISVNSVLVPVVVRDWRGKFVPGLSKESFDLKEDGTAQTVTFFQAENIPLELSIAVDISESMMQIMPGVKEGIVSFVNRLKPIDRVTLLAFNERVFVVTKSESDQGRLKDAISRLSPQGGTAIYDALVRSADSLGTQISRRAIVAFTDGKDQDSLATIGAVEDRFRSTDVSLYLIIYGRLSPADIAAQQPLMKLSEMTGGRVYRADKVGDLPEIFKDVIEDLSQHYLLGYSPSNVERDGTVRNIGITVPGKGSYELKFRNKYVAPVK
jgi:VWFA-related protein